jgi:hypothetical protein
MSHKLGHQRGVSEVVQMIGQRCKYTELEAIARNRIINSKYNGSIAFKVQFIWENCSEMGDKSSLAIEVDAALVWRFLMPCQSNGAAAPRFRGQISRLPPFQRFLNGADLFLDRCRLKNEFTNVQQRMAKWIGILIENLLNGEVIKWVHFSSISPFNKKVTGVSSL